VPMKQTPQKVDLKIIKNSSSAGGMT